MPISARASAGGPWRPTRQHQKRVDLWPATLIFGATEGRDCRQRHEIELTARGFAGG
jgi:hypothetical protein